MAASGDPKLTEPDNFHKPPTGPASQQSTDQEAGPNGSTSSSQELATLRAMIRESVAREVNPLRAQFDAFQAQIG